jgi:hypothetical protein
MGRNTYFTQSLWLAASSQSSAGPITITFMQQWASVMRYKILAFTRCDTCAGSVAATRTSTQKYEKYEGYKHALPRSSVIVQLLGDEGVVQETWRQKVQRNGCYSCAPESSLMKTDSKLLVRCKKWTTCGDYTRFCTVLSCCVWTKLILCWLLSAHSNTMILCH